MKENIQEGIETDKGTGKFRFLLHLWSDSGPNVKRKEQVLVPPRKVT